MGQFDAAYPVVLRQETGPGGWPGDVNDPDDPGKLTRAGVTQARYDEWRAAQHLPAQAVTAMAPDECARIYREYWTAVRGDDLPQAVALVVFDAAVNQGVGYARKLLQWGARVPQDGALGPGTLAAVAARNPGTLAEDLLWGRVSRYVATCRAWEAQGKPNAWKFLPGWLSRLAAVRTTLGA